MNQTTFRGVRSPYQPASVAQKPPVAGNPLRGMLQRLCGSYNLTATFSEDTEAVATMGNPNLVAIRCVLKKEGKPIGVGHGSSIISRMNRPTERTIFAVLNGALMSSVNSACKTLDVLRLDQVQEEAEDYRAAMHRETGSMQASTGDEPLTAKQRSYLMQLASVNLEESDRENFLASLDDMTKAEASRAIADFAH